VRHSKVRLPPDSLVRYVAVSPKGDELAWYLKFDEPPPASALLRSLHELLKRRPHSRQGLWVSRLDGSEMREIGHVHDDELTSMNWLPGGNHLTFTKEDNYYSVRVR
jgi:hypothetical protein